MSGLEKMHGKVIGVIGQLAQWHREHEPECRISDICLGPENMIAFSLMCTSGEFDPQVIAIVAAIEVRRLRDRNAELEVQLARAQAELTNWEDSADTLGPIGLPEDPVS